MLGLGDNEDEQRMWNFLIFKTPMSDKEIEDTPIIVPIIILVVAIGFAIWACS